jgi:hypothetical protein
MATGVPGEEITPIVTADFDQLSLTPTPSAASIIMALNGGYNVYCDNAGAGGNNTRLWIDGPASGEVLIGPRVGTDYLGQIRLKHNKSTASAGVVLRQDTNGVLYLTSSSRRYKTEIEDYRMDLEALRRLRVVRFKERGMIADAARGYAQERGDQQATEADVTRATDNAQWCLGAIAEEVDELGLVELVTYEDDPERPGEQRANGLRYEMFGLAAFQLIQAQAERIDSLEKRIDQMEERLK